MARAYHLLLSRDSASEPFGIAFGDYDRSVVVAERLAYRDQGFRAKDLRVVTSNTDNQSACNYVCRYENERESN